MLDKKYENLFGIGVLFMVTGIICISASVENSLIQIVLIILIGYLVGKLERGWVKTEKGDFGKLSTRFWIIAIIIWGLAFAISTEVVPTNDLKENAAKIRTISLVVGFVLLVSGIVLLKIAKANSTPKTNE